jgi:hypothetical protein
MESITGKIELTPSGKGKSAHLVAVLELTGERLALLVEEAARRSGAIQRNQRAIKNGSPASAALLFHGPLQLLRRHAH